MGGEKDACSGMTSGNTELRIRIEIGEPTHDASTPDDTTRGMRMGKGGRRAYLDLF